MSSFRCSHPHPEAGPWRPASEEPGGHEFPEVSAVPRYMLWSPRSIPLLQGSDFPLLRGKRPWISTFILAVQSVSIRPAGLLPSIYTLLAQQLIPGWRTFIGVDIFIQIWIFNANLFKFSVFQTFSTSSLLKLVMSHLECRIDWGRCSHGFNNLQTLFRTDFS